MIESVHVAYVENSTLKIDAWDRSKVFIKNSYVRMMEVGDDVYVKLINYILDESLQFLVESDNFTLDFVNSTFGNAFMEMASKRGLIKGSVNISLPVKVNFAKGVIVREYFLIVEDEDGNPMPNASVNLHDSEGGLIWNGTTDRSGRALFNITFTKENYIKEWKLTATVNGMNTSKKIGFLTSTPIILTLRKLSSSISLSVSRENVRKGNQITILGSISPPLAGITLTFEKPDGSTFVESVFTDSNGSFSYTLIPEDAGKWGVYASWLGDEKYEGASSFSVSFTVEAPLKPPWELYTAIATAAIVTIGVATIIYRRRRATS